MFDQTHPDQHEKDFGFSAKEVVSISLVLLLVGYAVTNPPLYYAGVLVTVVISALVLFGPVALVPYLIITMLLGPDISEGATEFRAFGGISVGSPWQLRLWFLTPGLWQGLLFCAGILRYRKITDLSIFRLPLSCFLLFGAIGTFCAIFTQGEVGVPLVSIVSDIKFVCFLFCSGALFSSHLQTFPRHGYLITQFLFLEFCVSLFVDFSNWCLGGGPQFSGVSCGTFDSIKWTTLIVLLTCVYHIFERRIQLKYLFLLLVSALMVTVYMSRKLYVNLIIGIFILFILSNKKFKYVVAFAPAVLVMIVALSGVVELIVGDLGRVYVARISQIGRLASFDLATIDPMRNLEYVNCFVSMSSDGTIWFGRGFGGWFSDDYVRMPDDLTAAYSVWAESSRHFNRVHFVVANLILKFGLVGTGVWLLTWFYAISRLLGATGLNERWHNFKNVALAATPVVFFSGQWSSKGLVLVALFFTLINFVVEKKAALSGNFIHQKNLERSLIGSKIKPTVI